MPRVCNNTAFVPHRATWKDRKRAHTQRDTKLISRTSVDGKNFKSDRDEQHFIPKRYPYIINAVVRLVWVHQIILGTVCWYMFVPGIIVSTVCTIIPKCGRFLNIFPRPVCTNAAQIKTTWESIRPVCVYFELDYTSGNESFDTYSV